MTEFTLHTEDTASEALGLLEGYNTLHAFFMSFSFDKDEITAVWRSINMDDNAVQQFLDADFTKRQIMEVILGVAQKVMCNYTNHLADTLVDACFCSWLLCYLSSRGAQRRGAFHRSIVSNV